MLDLNFHFVLMFFANLKVFSSVFLLGPFFLLVCLFIVKFSLVSYIFFLALIKNNFNNKGNEYI
jgi:hypothetical protein